MEAKELRIGNYVTHKHSLIWNPQVNIELLTEISDETNDFLPIPLTEEWFNKFGADKEVYEYDESDYYLVIRHDKFDIIYESDEIIYCCIGGKVFDLKYVHQMQNLYYSLSGEGLTIKNK